MIFPQRGRSFQMYQVQHVGSFMSPEGLSPHLARRISASPSLIFHLLPNLLSTGLRYCRVVDWESGKNDFGIEFFLAARLEGHRRCQALFVPAWPAAKPTCSSILSTSRYVILLHASIPAYTSSSQRSRSRIHSHDGCPTKPQGRRHKNAE